MDKYLSTQENSARTFDPPPVLIAADSNAARARAINTIMLAGLRVGDAVPIEDARDRIGRQGDASAIWIELESDAEGIDAILNQVQDENESRRFPVVIAAGAELLESLAPYALEPGVDLVISGDDAERAAAIAIASSGVARAGRVSDISADKNADRLRQLSDEVSRIAATLARLSTGPAPTMPPPVIEARQGAPDIPVEVVRTAIRARRLRARYFSEELFADPAWDMLLDLLQAEIAHLRVPVSSLCIAAAVPATTALRWLKTMVQQGLFVRRADPHDGRRVFVELSPESSGSLRRYFAEVGNAAVI